MRVRNEAMRMNTVRGVDVPVQKYEVVYRMIPAGTAWFNDSLE